MACLKKEVKSVLVEFIVAMDGMAASLGMTLEAFHKGLYDSTRRIITPPPPPRPFSQPATLKPWKRSWERRDLKGWRSGFTVSAQETTVRQRNPGYRPHFPPKAPGTFLRVMKESIDMNEVLITDLEGLYQGIRE